MAENLSAVPEAVLKALEQIRAEGHWNMLAYNSIVREMIELADSGDDLANWRAAASWLIDNKTRYMEALNQMGALRGKAR